MPSFPYFYRAVLKVLLLLLLILILILQYVSFDEKKRIQHYDAVAYEKCYFHDGKNPNDVGKEVTYFEDLLNSAKQPRFDQGIFFVETRCSDNIIPNIKPR